MIPINISRTGCSGCSLSTIRLVLRGSLTYHWPVTCSLLPSCLGCSVSYLLVKSLAFSYEMPSWSVCLLMSELTLFMTEPWILSPLPSVLTRSSKALYHFPPRVYGRGPVEQEGEENQRTCHRAGRRLPGWRKTSLRDREDSSPRLRDRTAGGRRSGGNIRKREQDHKEPAEAKQRVSEAGTETPEKKLWEQRQVQAQEKVWREHQPLHSRCQEHALQSWWTQPGMQGDAVVGQTKVEKPWTK